MGTLVKICLAVSLIWVLSFAQEPNVVWTQTFGGNMGDMGYSVDQTNDGGFIIVGTTYSFGAGNTDVYLVKTDPLGNKQWSKTFGTSNYDEGYSVQQTNDGGYIITGTYNDNGTQGDVYLIKTYPSGNIQWWKSIGTSAFDCGHCVQQTSDDGYIIVGTTYGYASPGDVYLVKTNSQGTVEWTRHYGTNWNDYGFYVQQTTDGGYIITGQVFNTKNNSADVWLIKTDTYGYMEWDNMFGWPSYDRGYCVQQTRPDGGYIINGWLDHPEGNFMWLIKTDASGNLQWDKKLRDPSPSAARGYSVQQTEDLGYIAVGDVMLLAYNWDVYAVKTDRDGNIEWQKTIDGFTYHDHGRSVALVRDGSYIIAGSTSPNPNAPPWSEVYLIKIGYQIADTDDSLALAYNGNRHLARNSNNGGLFLIYTCDGKILYTNSTDNGDTWTYPPFEVGEGSYPTIALSSDGLPSVVWTDDHGLLWYRRQNSQGIWEDIWNIDIELPLNSPPSMVITPSKQCDTVHVITTHLWPKMKISWLVEYSFSVQGPSPYFDHLIEGGQGLPIRYYPSIARCEEDNSLHAVWQREDTICYATRSVGQSWQNWGWQFDLYGIHSAHPFVETYGDSIFVVWQRMGVLSEEVHRAAKQLLSTDFSVCQLTLNYTPTLMPVNVCGRFTVLSDNSSAIWCHDFYEDNWYNISQEPHEWCDYPHAVGNQSDIYTVWLETATAASTVYRIRFNALSITSEYRASGPMMIDDHHVHNTSFAVSPNPFTERLEIKCLIIDMDHNISIKIYDICGKLVKNFFNGSVNAKSVYYWKGDDENGRLVSQGIYILRFENLSTGEISVQKILKVK